ncbi:unnamed protein product [Rotaria sordida]|uniref:Uncharacterized protein n=1 Tax=Rotaria sordida TaxID=392033 RepID=A0A815INS0_9BILA|nr:unnamed protein product [Rotaria sordida]CAF1094413.1 unnamed protein product [Rotaria sordida]CAF1140724.1 unnamed protein product [Rotaria sordida]CAF1371032.1 unnamed protein product [Rotaria sordida]CAF3983830.1 unnamed protein product [Rotaria sordida]
MPTSSQRSIAVHPQSILFTAPEDTITMNKSTEQIETILTVPDKIQSSRTSCVTPYVQAPSGNCVNTLLDFNNCGTVGKICSSGDTSCSAAACSNTIPIVQLVNYTSIWIGGNDGSADDEIFNVTLPFTITLYNTTTNYIQVTTNGVLCLSYCSNAWVESPLPTTSFGAAVLPYWDDLYIYAKTWQGIYFASQGTAPSRTLVFEYYMSHYGSPNQYYHFQVAFFEATPGITKFTYFDAYDTGASCTIGVQGSYNGQFISYSFDVANSVIPSMTLTFDTNVGTYTNGSTIG